MRNSFPTPKILLQSTESLSFVTMYGKPFYYLLGNVDILFIYKISYKVYKISNKIY